VPVAIDFPHRLAGHCASGAFRDLLEFRGYRHRGEALSEAMVFGLGAGLDLLLLVNPGPRTPFYLGGRAPMFEESLMRRIGGSVFRRSETDNDAAWTWVRAKLDRGEPVAMVGDCQKLEYLKTRTSMPLHVIVATGYDDTHALIADNDRAEIQRCSHESLRAARSATGFPLPAMNVTFEIEWPEKLPPLDALVHAAIAETLHWFDEPHGPPAAIFGADKFGVVAIDRLEAMAREWIESRPAQSAAHAMLLWIAIEKAGTGGGLFRQLWAGFLREANEIVPSPALAAARDHYTQLAAEWTALGVSCGNGRFDGAAERLLGLVKGERDGLAALREIGGRSSSL
jgi:hypothetical protein